MESSHKKAPQLSSTLQIAANATRPLAPEPMRLRLLKLAQTLPLWLSRDNQPFIASPTAIPLYSEEFFALLLHLAAKHLNHFPSLYEFTFVRSALDQQARTAKQKQPIHTRIVKLTPRSYQIDLTTEDQQVINITGKRWKQSTRPRTRFHRLELQTPLPSPSPVAFTLAECFERIFATPPADAIRLAIWLAEAFLPDRKPPVLIITGEARDEAVSLLRNLIDPVIEPIIYSPTCPIELDRMSLDHKVLAFSVWNQPTATLVKKLNTIHQGTRIRLRHTNKRKPRPNTTVQRPVLIASQTPIEINKDQITIEINATLTADPGKIFHALLDLLVKLTGQSAIKPRYLTHAAPAGMPLAPTRQPQVINTS